MLNWWGVRSGKFGVVVLKASVFDSGGNLPVDLSSLV